MKKQLPIFIGILIVVAGCSFYGGTKFGNKKNNKLGGNTGRNFQNMQNMTPEQQQERMQQGGQGRGINGQGGFTSGDIISKDDKSITVKMRDGGSKIIFFSGSTQITKSADGTTNDLATGKSISVSGDTNQDGSITAKTIQLRPADLTK